MGTNGPEHMEVEWQFTAADLAAVERWLDSKPGKRYRVRRVGTARLSDTYYDTEDWRLHRAGFTCRVRASGDGFELTLKSMAESKGGMRSRRELNEPVESPTGEAMLQAPGACGEAIRAVVGTRAVRPLFAVETERTTYALDDEEGVLGEVALDETSIAAGENEGARLSRSRWRLMRARCSARRNSST